MGYILSGPVENVPRRINDLSVNLAVTHVLKAIATVESSDTLCTQTLIRAKGRLSYSDLTYDTKFPILIPSRNLVTTLIIKACHKVVQHNGVKETLCQLRTKYWVCKARQRIKTILSNCITCKKHSQKQYSEPLTAQLPDYRVTKSVPFSTCGIDFAGPFYVRHSKEVILDKVYLCLYTCASSRAVYLDLSTDLTAEAFIRSFKRFSTRRGFPQRVISDNAKNFKSANQQLSALFELPSVQRYLAEKRVRWQFNLDRASWYGGIFERLIKSVKTCLKKVIGRARLTYDELLTVIVECETIINSRPLTFVYSDDVEEPLTPGHLLHGRRILSLPEVADVTVQELNRESMTRRAKYLNTLLVHFLRRWKKEYLVGLREYHRMKSLNAGQEVIQEGDVVSIHDSTLNFEERILETWTFRISHTRKGSRSAWSRSKSMLQGTEALRDQASTPAIVSLGITFRSTDG